MLFHLSIDADHPQHVAEVLAEIWGGVALPFPPVVEGSWMAFAGDERSTMVEVYPRGTQLREAEGGGDAFGVIEEGSERSATHFAMGTSLSAEQVLLIVAREGWPAKYCARGGKFGVLEIWIEGTRMIEVLTPDMQSEYKAFVTPENWREMLAQGTPLAVAA